MVAIICIPIVLGAPLLWELDSGGSLLSALAAMGTQEVYRLAATGGWILSGSREQLERSSGFSGDLAGNVCSLCSLGLALSGFLCLFHLYWES
ncbi:MAG: hypothetical protein Ct9H300mP15_09270 [Gemmatimonadota bacterium]|nr:MAG: hypothetical protein Ct9H300mP15_09270 [Gemmatimonadota bacterium]